MYKRQLKPVDAAKSAAAAKATEVTKSVESAKSRATTKAIESAGHIEAAKSAATAKATEVGKIPATYLPTLPAQK